MKGIYKISIYIIIPSPLSFLDLDPNTALRRQADLWGLGSKMLEMRGRYDVAYYSPYLSFLWWKPSPNQHGATPTNPCQVRAKQIIAHNLYMIIQYTIEKNDEKNWTQ